MSNIELHLNEIRFEDLYSIHKMCDQDFEPSLSSRTDIKTYCQKLFEKADKISVSSDGKLAGLLCVYTNDSVSKIAFISSVVILKSYRRLGLGNSLIKRAISLSRENNMSFVKLEVGKTNFAALNLYKKYGFGIEKENDLTYLMTRESNGR